ncbi:MAG: hypothetical protein M3R08_02660 [Bacteroidota bacterium]|nr:hypothetical protein [Bacteroidota bacterium]
MKPLLHYPDSLTRHYNDLLISRRPCVDEAAERDARVREGVGMSERNDLLPAMFASYGNGPFLMPSLQFPR